MSRRHLRRTGPGPLELIEEAVHLLRLAPWAVLGGYYLGSLPFVLGLLYFWTDMSRGSAAYKHCAPASFAVALLFLWMKTWQAIFARQLKEQIAGRSASVVALSGFVRTAINQTILQPSGLFLLPLSLLIVLPFGWLYAFYQSVNAFAAEDGAAAKHVFQRAARQAQLWPRQNHAMLGVLFFFGLVVFLDVAIGLATVPSLVKMLFGIENAFTRSPWGLLNSTFMATVGALTYLSLDPLVKAVYLLRCFYGESQHTGEDLRTELKQFVQSAGVAAMVLLPVVLTFAAMDEPRREAINYNYCARNGTLNWFESPSIALRAPSPPLGEKDGMRGFGSWKPFTTSWSRIGTKHRWRSPSPVLRTPSPPVGEYPFSVAAGVPPAVEPGILPGGFSCGLRRQFRVQSCQSGRQDAALYGSQDGCRYSREPTLNTYVGERDGVRGCLGSWNAASNHNFLPLPVEITSAQRTPGLLFLPMQYAVGMRWYLDRSADSQSAVSPNSEISPPDLDRSIEQVLDRREFNWRLPRERPAEDDSQKGVFAGFMDGLITTMRSWVKAIGSGIKAVGRWVGDAIDWLREKILGKNAKAPQEGSAGTDWMVSLQGLIFVLLVLAACAAAILFYRTWRRRGSRKVIESESVAAVPNVADDNVSASQLPEDDWLRLARELMGQGELRLALRAFYLAGLAHLAQREMIRVAKFKSNRDYEHELRRRARALPELQAAFSENVGIFDHAWYGLHDVTHEALQRFQINLEKIKAC